MIRGLLFLVGLSLATMPCRAGDIDMISGRYIYETYSFTLPTGQSAGFKELDASGATLDIGRDMSIALTMHMLDGTDSVSHAQILELHLEQDTGYWLAKWPEMAYPVRKDFKLFGDTIRYVIRFDDSSDIYRYGGSDQGILRRLSASPRDAP